MIDKIKLNIIYLDENNKEVGSHNGASIPKTVDQLFKIAENSVKEDIKNGRI